MSIGCRPWQSKTGVWKDTKRPCQRHRNYHHRQHNPHMRVPLLLFLLLVLVLLVVLYGWGMAQSCQGGGRWCQSCRDIAENGLDVTLIWQFHVYTGCTSPAITTVVTICIPIWKPGRRPEIQQSPLSTLSSSSSSPSPSLHAIVVVVVVVVVVVDGIVVIGIDVIVVVVGVWFNRVSDWEDWPMPHSAESVKRTG